MILEALPNLNNPGLKLGPISSLVLLNFVFTLLLKGFPGGSDGTESACNERDLGLIPGPG